MGGGWTSINRKTRPCCAVRRSDLISRRSVIWCFSLRSWCPALRGFSGGAAAPPDRRLRTHTERETLVCGLQFAPSSFELLILTSKSSFFLFLADTSTCRQTPIKPASTRGLSLIYSFICLTPHVSPSVLFFKRLSGFSRKNPESVFIYMHKAQLNEFRKAISKKCLCLATQKQKKCFNR